MISYHTCPRASQEGKETGGMNVYVLEASRALARMGNEVDIFTRSHEPDDPLIIQEEAHLRVMHIPAGPREALPKKKLPAYIPEFITEAKRFVHDQSLTYDIIHAHYYQSGIVARKALITSHIPFVMSFHTLALMKNLVARDTLERESLSRIHTEELLVKRADRIIAASDTDKEYLEYLYDAPQEKVRVVYPGIDPELFKPMDKRVARSHIHADPSHKIALFVGRVEPLKGIDTLLYAMKILYKKHVPLCLWIVGGDISETPDRWPKTLKELSRLRATLGIPAENVHFVGRERQSELPYYYNAADVVVMPSHYESFGMSALEAMACGVPVVTTNVAGIATQVEHVTSVNNPLLLAEIISRVVTLPQSPRPFHAFTWHETAEKLLAVYRELI